MLKTIVALALAALTGTALAQGKAELLWLGQAAFRITTPGGIGGLGSTHRGPELAAIASRMSPGRIRPTPGAMRGRIAPDARRSLARIRPPRENRS